MALEPILDGWDAIVPYVGRRIIVPKAGSRPVWGLHPYFDAMDQGDVDLFAWDYSVVAIPGDTMVSASILSSPAGLMAGTPVITGNVVQVFLGPSMAAYLTYMVTCRAVFASGRVLDWDAEIAVFAGLADSDGNPSLNAPPPQSTDGRDVLVPAAARSVVMPLRGSRPVWGMHPAFDPMEAGDHDVFQWDFSREAYPGDAVTSVSITSDHPGLTIDPPIIFGYVVQVFIGPSTAEGLTYDITAQIHFASGRILDWAAQIEVLES